MASGSGYRAGAAVRETVLLLVEECRARVSGRKFSVAPVLAHGRSRSGRGDYLAEADFRADAASPRKTAANTTKTTPMPEESRVKSTIATIRNKIPAAALPSACLDM